MLHHHIKRCAGRFGLQARSDACKDRERCLRFMTLMRESDIPSASREPYPHTVHVILRDDNNKQCQFFMEDDHGQTD
jgi:hypothetical protein